VDQIWCLGDVVGYGAQPNECTALVKAQCQVSLVGNHDLAALEQLDISTFSPAAASAVRWTREAMSDSTREYLGGLKPSDESHDVALYHASPRDPIWEYVLWPDQAAQCIRAQAKRVSFVGHSHVALFFALADARGGGQVDDARGAQAAAGTSLDVRRGRWLVNPGSVGQPREWRALVRFAVIDLAAGVVRYRAASYDDTPVRRALAEAGLPPDACHRRPPLRWLVRRQLGRARRSLAT
jgi:diadenosine tetraphosphatase ApaH/serine/threonine PP2A family protein phosphatase